MRPGKFVNWFEPGGPRVNPAKIAKPIFVLLIAAMLLPVQLLSTPASTATKGLSAFPLAGAGRPWSDSAAARAPVQLIGDRFFAETPAGSEKDVKIARLPLYFIPNRGQIDESVVYYAAGAGYNFYLAREGVTYAFVRHYEGAGAAADPVLAGPQLESGEPEKNTEGYTLKVAFSGASPEVVIEGLGQKEGKVNYFTGSDESDWQTDIPTFEEVVYRELYPGIDLTYRGKEGMLKYEFIVAPGADPAQIRMVYRGADSLEIDENGNLVIATPWGSLQDEKPYVYQVIDDQEVRVDAAFAVTANAVTFTVGDYDRNLHLMIDPGLAYSTFLGGSGGDSGDSITVDAGGCVYVTGRTGPSDFPTTTGAYDTSPNGRDDAFITKLNPSGSDLIYSTFLGGWDCDSGHSIAVDAGGCAYITGFAGCDFPTTPGAYDTDYNGVGDVFVAKLNPSGSNLLYSTFLGGSSWDYGYSIAVDADGCAYITGSTGSSDYPTTRGAYDTGYNGDLHDAFITKLNPSGSALLYSTYLGGNGDDHGWSIAVDAGGCAYVTGDTGSSDFPITPGVYDTSHNGSHDAFITKLNPSGSDLIYSTFLGGGDEDLCYSIAIDASGCAYVTGDTGSPDFPTTPGAYDTSHNGSDDAFITKLNPSGSDLIYSTFLGGDNCDSGHSIAVDAGGCAYVTGDTMSPDFPTTPGAYDTNYNDDQDVFVAKLNPSGSNLLYSTFLGGCLFEYGLSIAVDGGGCTYVSGYTWSHDFPTTPEVYDTSFSGYGDAFIAKLKLPPSDFPVTALIPALSPYHTDTGLNPYCYHTWDRYKSYVGQCTWYVYGRIQETGLIDQDRLSPAGRPYIFRSHARTWLQAVDQYPSLLTIEDSPQRGDIALWLTGGLGHVAFVEEVSDGRVLVTESNIPPRKGGHVVVGSPLGVCLRSSRRVMDDNLVTVAPRFSVLEVIDGPKNGGGYTWYLLKDSGGETGWAARLGEGAVYNYTGISFEPSPPVLGRPDHYIRIHTESPTPPEPPPALEKLSIKGWNVAEPRVAAGGTAGLRLDLANDGSIKRTFYAGAILEGPGGKRVIVDQEVTLNPQSCRSIALYQNLDLPGSWSIQFGIWKQKPSAESSPLLLFPASPLRGYITVELARPAAPRVTGPGSSLAPGTTLDTLTPLLEWQETEGADRYELWISRAPYGEKNIIHSSGPLKGTGYKVPEGVLEDGESYRWNMAAYNSAGRSDFSSRLHFRIDPDRSLPDGEDPWAHWRAMVERTIQVEHYSPPAGKVQRPWVFKEPWTLPYKGADYSAVLALDPSVYIYWTEADWLPLCKAVGEREILARLIHAEAANQGIQGWTALANSVVNRVNNPAHPNTTCGVIFEIRTRGVPQYCGVLSERFLKFDSEQVRQGIYEIAGRALDGTLGDITGGATSFYNPDLVNSKWHESRGGALKIGEHVFAQ